MSGLRIMAMVDAVPSGTARAVRADRGTGGFASTLLGFLTPGAGDPAVRAASTAGANGAGQRPTDGAALRPTADTDTEGERPDGEGAGTGLRAGDGVALAALALAKPLPAAAAVFADAPDAAVLADAPETAVAAGTDVVAGADVVPGAQTQPSGDVVEPAHAADAYGQPAAEAVTPQAASPEVAVATPEAGGHDRTAPLGTGPDPAPVAGTSTGTDVAQPAADVPTGNVPPPAAERDVSAPAPDQGIAADAAADRRAGARSAVASRAPQIPGADPADGALSPAGGTPEGRDASPDRPAPTAGRLGGSDGTVGRPAGLDTMPDRLAAPDPAVPVDQHVAPATGTAAPQEATGEAAPKAPPAPVSSRIVELVERLRTEPPPRQIVVDLEQFGVGRLVISLRSDTVVVGALDRGINLDAQWWQELGAALDERGWSLDGRDGQPQHQRHQPQPQHQRQQDPPPIIQRRSRAHADDGLRL